MISGLYTAASGLLAQTHQQDVIANNLANVNTTGYKRDRALYVPFPTVFLNRINDEKVSVPGGFADAMVPIGQMGRGVELRVDGIKPELIEEGSMNQTGNKLDFAIKGQGMFVVMTPNGLRYTRDGSFSLDSDGILVNSSGHKVLGQRGEIILDGKEIFTDEAGNIFVDGKETDTFRIALYEKDSPLRKEGDNLFYPLNNMPLPETEDEGKVRIIHGYLEGSNVNVVREMVDMISAYRAYEAAQRAVQAQEQTLSKAVNDVGNIQI